MSASKDKKRIKWENIHVATPIGAGQSIARIGVLAKKNPPGSADMGLSFAPCLHEEKAFSKKMVIFFLDIAHISRLENRAYFCLKKTTNQVRKLPFTRRHVGGWHDRTRFLFSVAGR